MDVLILFLHINQTKQKLTVKNLIIWEPWVMSQEIKLLSLCERCYRM